MYPTNPTKANEHIQSVLFRSLLFLTTLLYYSSPFLIYHIISWWCSLKVTYVTNVFDLKQLFSI